MAILRRRHIPVLVSLYITLGRLGISLSDRLVIRITNHPNALARLHSLQGWLLIGFTATLLSGFLWQAVRVRERRDATIRAQAADLREGEAAIAIENARLDQTALQKSEQLGALLRASRSLMAGLDLRTTLEHIATEAARIAHCEHAKLLLVDKDAQVLRIAVLRGMRAPEGFPLPLGVGLSGMVAATGQPLYIADTQNDPRSLLAGFDRAVGLRTYLGLPIKIHDEVLGVLTLNTPTPREYPADELIYFTSFADQAALAIENARLFQEQQQAYGHLQRAQQELVRSEKLRALGQLAAGIAHDLNNCLAAIIGQVDMLRLSNASPGLDEEFTTILTAANDGAHIVRRLQDFGRRRPIHALGPVPLHLVVLEAFDITRPQWQTDSKRRGRPITVETAISDLPPVQGNAAEIREALTNLILNAVDAMPTGGTLSFRARAIPAPTGTDSTPLAIELQVTDTGSGMSEDVRERIFDPFFTTKGPLGTGMGLSVVYGIVERHGGRIDVTSAPGHGTTFTLRFQVAHGPADALPLPSVPPTSVPLRVLVVDDEARVLEVLTSMLESGGHSAIPADSGLAGLTRLTESRPDLVLTDLSMPDMSGLEFARHVRAAYPHLPILLCTGWNDITDAQELTRGAVTAVLEKPLSVMQLLTAIEQYRPARDGRAAS